jgi:hypothetical protein
MKKFNFMKVLFLSLFFVFLSHEIAFSQNTPTYTPTYTFTSTWTYTPTFTYTNTPGTPTPTPLYKPGNASENTLNKVYQAFVNANPINPTNTPTVTYSPTSTRSYTPTYTYTNTPTYTSTYTYTTVYTSTPTWNMTLTTTPTQYIITPTNTYVYTNTPVYTATNTYTPTTTYTSTPIFTATSTYTFTPIVNLTNTGVYGSASGLYATGIAMTMTGNVFYKDWNGYITGTSGSGGATIACYIIPPSGVIPTTASFSVTGTGNTTVVNSTTNPTIGQSMVISISGLAASTTITVGGAGSIY